MTPTLTRHDFPVDNMDEAMAPIVQSTEDALSELETSEFDRFDALDYSLTVAKWTCLTDPVAGEFPTWEAWVTAMQVGSGLFISGAAADGPVPCRIGSKGEIKNLPATGPQEYLHAGNWLTSYYLAMICRDNERLDQLACIPVSFLRASGVEFDEYIYAWVETLQNAWFGSQETWDTLVTAINAMDPAAPHIASAELMLKILYPPLEAFHRYQRQVPEPFPDAELIDLGKTANGAHQFDQVYRLDHGRGDLLIVEAKAPDGRLGRRWGEADQARRRVKQGTVEYVKTIAELMEARGGKEADIAAEIKRALRRKEGLQYILVQAAPHTGTYAGAAVKYFKIF
ncbi:Imm49 family immunity protein [Streptomyces sp. YIM S03343]